MALQGTIETFALPDVLRLLANTKKTGCLRLDGNRGSGSLWVDGGAVVGGEASAAPHASNATEVLFELLRFADGDFVFDGDTEPETAGSPEQVEPMLEAAEQMLDEWKKIEAVVPSLDHSVSLAPELPGDEVTITGDRWKTLVAIAGGTSVGMLGDRLALGELPVSRAVKELVELGLIELGEPREGLAGAPATEAASFEPSSFESTSFEPSPFESEPSFGSDSFEASAFESAPVVALAPDDEDEDAFVETFDPDALVIDETSASPFEDALAAPVSAEVPEPDAADAAEIARQLANLPPKAAKAVAAAAKATTVEEREAALASIEDGEDINRELLIKFLGSVNS